MAARDDSSDDEWDPDEAAGASDEEDSDVEDSEKGREGKGKVNDTTPGITIRILRVPDHQKLALTP